MTDSAEFLFDSNIAQVRQLITTELGAIAREVETAEGRLGRSATSSTFLDSYVDKISTEGAQLLQNVQNIVTEAKTALSAGLQPPDVGKGVRELVAKYKAGITQIQREMLGIVPPELANSNIFKSVTTGGAERVSGQLRSQLEQAKTELTRLGGSLNLPGSTLSSLGGFGQSKQMADILETAIPKGARTASAAMERLLDTVGRTATGFRRLSDDARASLSLGADGKGSLAGAGIERTGQNNDRFRFTDPVTGNTLETRGNQIVDITQQEQRAAEKTLKEKERAASAEQSRAAAAEKAAAEEARLIARAIALEAEANDATNRRVKAEVLRAAEAEGSARRVSNSRTVTANNEVFQYDRSGLSADKVTNPNAIAEAQAANLRATQRETEARENNARALTANAGLGRGDGQFTQVGKTRYAFDANQSAFVDTNTGKLITNMAQVRSLTGQLSDQMHKLAEAEFGTKKTIGDEFIKGFFGSGGRKYRGGAQEIDRVNPLNGFAETAGVVAKYEILGRGIMAIGQGAAQSFSDFANLDHAIAEYDSVVGHAGAASQSYINDLENLSIVAGINVVDALQAATRGVAAFADTNASASEKNAIGKQFVGAVAQYSIITNQTPQASANDLIAAGSSFQLTADRIDEVANAVAVARQTFGADGAQVGQGLQLLADVGKEAGFSLNELAQVIGLVQARTGESGTALAGNLQRIFALFSGNAGKNALRNAGVDASGSVKDQIESLAKAYPHLSDAQRQSVNASLGGARSLRDLIPLLSENEALQKAFSRAITDGTAADREANAEINSLAGQLKQFSTLLRTLAVDIARTGILAPIIIGLEVLKPLLSVLDKLIQQYDRLPSAIKGTVAVLAELALGWKLVTSAQAQAIAGNFTGGATGFIARFFDPARKAAGPTGDFADGLGPKGRFAGAVDNLAVTRATNVTELAAAEQRLAALKKVGASEIELAAATSSLQEAQVAAAEREIAARELVRTSAMEYTVAQDAEAAATDRVTVALNALAVSAEAAGTANAGAAVSDVASVAGTATKTAEAGASAAVTEAKAAETLASFEAAGADQRAALSVIAFTTAIREATINTAIFAREQLAKVANPSSNFGKAAVVGAFAFADFELFKSRRGIADADEGAAKADRILSKAGADPAAIKDAASQMSKAAGDLNEASSGILGSLTDQAAEFLGNKDSSEEAARLTRRARQAERTANRLEDDQNKAAVGGFIDFTAVDGVKNGLEAMTDSGRTAQQQLEALATSMETLALTTEGKRIILPGQGRVLADRIAQSVANSTSGIADEATDSRTSHFGVGNLLKTAGQAVSIPLAAGQLIRGSKTDINKSGEDLQGLNFNKLNKGISDELTKFIANRGLDTGKELNDRQIIALQNKAVQAMKDSIAKQGKDFKDLPGAVRRRLIEGARQGAQKVVDDLSKPSEFTSQNIDDVVKNAAALAQTAGGDVSVSATLDGTEGGGNLAGAQTRLALLQRIKADAIKLGKKPRELAQVNQDIKVAELALQQATIESLKADQSLADSLISPFDKSGQIRAQIADLQAQLGLTTGDTERKAIEGQINQLNNQLAQQDVSDTNAGALSGVDSRRTVQVAKTQLDNAKRQLDLVTRENGTGEELANAKKAVDDGILAVAQAELDKASAMRSSTRDPRDVLGKAQDEINNALDNLATQDPGTTGYAQGQTRLHEARQAKADAVADAAKARNSAGASPGTLADANAAIRNAEIDLRRAGPDQAAAAQAERALNDARIAYGQTAAEIGKAANSTGLFSNSKLQTARDAVRDAALDLRAAVPGTAAFYDALRAENEARRAYADAVAEAASVKRQLSIDLTDPVATARNTLRDARSKLRRDKRAGAPADVRNEDKLAIQTDRNALEASKFSQRLSDAQTNYDLGRTSFSAYMRYLDSEHDRLTAIKHRTRQQQDQLNEVDQTMKQAKSQLDGVFNIGDIKLPTPYEVRRSLGIDALETVKDIAGSVGKSSVKSPSSGSSQSTSSALAAAAAAIGKSGGQHSQTVQIHINGADTHKVIEVIKEYLGPKATTRSGTTYRRR